MSTTRILLVSALGAIAALPACSGGGGGLDFTDGVCREHGEVFECSPLGETCGCADGEACRPQLDGARICVPAGGVAEDGACVSGDECESGLWCVAGQCTAFCDLRTGGLGCPGGTCSDVVGSDAFPFGACAHDGCDPVYGTGCPAGGPGCSLLRFEGDPQDVTVCYEAGPGVHGDPCEEEGCAAGHVCLRTELGRSCVQLCEIGNHTPCTRQGLALGCVGTFDEEVEVGGRRFGYCVG